MRRQQFLRCALGALLAPVAGPPARATAVSESLHWDTRSLVGFGTTLSLQAAHTDPARLREALDAAVALLQRLHGQMNLFDPDSALSRLNRQGQLAHPPAELLGLLRRAQAISARSGGSFDVTVQPLWVLYDHCRQQGRLPTSAEREAARQKVGWQGLQLATDEIRLARPGMGVTLNGIAQGHAADLTAQLLRQHGVAHALVDAGEWAAEGRNAKGQPWTLAVADPRQADAWVDRVGLQGACLATSADNPSCFTPDFRHHHILDPRSGDSPPAFAEVSVLAREGALADALTKVVFMAGPQRAAAVARDWGVGVMTIDKAGRRWSSAGWPGLGA